MYHDDGGGGHRDSDGKPEKKKFYANVYRPGGGGRGAGTTTNKTTTNANNKSNPPFPRMADQLRQQQQQRNREGPASMLYLKESPQQVSDITLFTAARESQLNDGYHEGYNEQEEQEQQNVAYGTNANRADALNSQPRHGTAGRGRTVTMARTKVTESFLGVREPNQVEPPLSRPGPETASRPNPATGQQQQSRWTRTVFRPGAEPATNPLQQQRNVVPDEPALPQERASELYAPAGSTEHMPHVSSDGRRPSDSLEEQQLRPSSLDREMSLSIMEEPPIARTRARRGSAGQSPPIRPNRKTIEQGEWEQPQPPPRRGGGRNNNNNRAASPPKNNNNNNAVRLRASVAPVREPSLDEDELPGPSSRNSANNNNSQSARDSSQPSYSNEAAVRLFGKSSGGPRRVTAVQGTFAASIVRVREPNDDTSEDTSSRGGGHWGHRRVASDPDALSSAAEPEEYENEHYRSEPVLNYHHEVDNFPLEPMQSVHESHEEASSAEPSKGFYGGAPTNRSLLSDDTPSSSDSRDRSSATEPTRLSDTSKVEQTALRFKPSLLPVTGPNGEPQEEQEEKEPRPRDDTELNQTETEQGEPRTPRRLATGSSTASSLSFSTVGSGESIRIVPFDASKASGSRRTPSTRSIERIHSLQSDAPLEEEKRDWSCGQCSYVNGQSDVRCAVCGADQQEPGDSMSASQSRPSLAQWRSSRRVLRSSIVLGPSVTEEGAWLCMTCTYMNQNALHLSCEICGEPRSKSDASALKLLEDPEADARNQHDAGLVGELREKVMEKEHILDLLGQQGEILAELREMDAFTKSNDPDAVDQFRREVADKGRYLDKIREELTQALAKEQNEMDSVETEQHKRRSALLEATGADSMNDLMMGDDASSRAPPEALEWMAQQRMLDEWRSQVEARALQLEEMRLHQEEEMREYGRRVNS